VEARIVERIRQGLLEKRDSLTEWLHATPLNKKEIFLGPSTTQAVQARLGAIDTAIGLVEDADFGENSLDLQAGDLLVLYTDGVTEALNRHDQEFGRERLATQVRRVDHLPARDVVNQIRQGLEEFSGGRPFVDDTTFVVCRITR
jgi:serine phosphatase RsbU (regulator of sigma subunit)